MRQKEYHVELLAAGQAEPVSRSAVSRQLSPGGVSDTRCYDLGIGDVVVVSPYRSVGEVGKSM
ncbi:hypothetical protein E4U35_008238 [Claviceps purpurea]|nr:hypothetical protein E4U35_008238 [Claviceps purpurea]